VLKALNVSKETIVASDLKEAAGFFQRLVGLMGRPPGENEARDGPLLGHPYFCMRFPGRGFPDRTSS
jgi:hypothetical protein